MVFCLSFTSFASEWEWLDQYDVDDGLNADLDGVTPNSFIEQTDPYKKDEITIYEDFKENKVEAGESFIKSASAKNWSLTPSQFEFYRLKDQGFSDCLDIFKHILQGNSNWVAFINVISNTSARLYLCEYGSVGYTTLSNSTTIDRFFFGQVSYQEFNSLPNFYALTYNHSNHTWTDYKNTVLTGSTNGWHYKKTGYDPVDASDVFSLYSIPTSSTDKRDWYYFGRIYIRRSDYTGLSTATNVSLNMQLGNSNKTIHFAPSSWQYMRGIISSIMPSSSSVPSTIFLSNSETTYNNFLLDSPVEPEPTFNESYTQDNSSINDSLQSFISRTSSFNTLLSNNRASLKSSIKSYFDNFNSLLPASITIILVLLVILFVVIGVLK